MYDLFPHVRGAEALVRHSKHGIQNVYIHQEFAF
jgi:hypothetical protein